MILTERNTVVLLSRRELIERIQTAEEPFGFRFATEGEPDAELWKYYEWLTERPRKTE